MSLLDSLPLDVKKYVLLSFLDSVDILVLKIALYNYIPSYDDFPYGIQERVVSKGLPLIFYFREYINKVNLFYYAAATGRTDVMEFFKGEPGIFYVERQLIEIASKSGHVNVIEFIRELYPYSTLSCNLLLERRASKGYVYTFRYIEEYGYNRMPTSEFWSKIAINAVRGGHLPILEYMEKEGYNLFANHQKLYYHAARKNYMNIILYLKERCGWHEIVCTTAAARGNMKLLQFSRENGCPFTQCTVIFAAKYGHLSILIYLCENIPIDLTNKEPLYFAIREGHMDCVEYLHSIGYPLDQKAYNMALNAKREEIAEYIAGILFI